MAGNVHATANPDGAVHQSGVNSRDAMPQVGDLIITAARDLEREQRGATVDTARTIPGNFAAGSGAGSTRRLFAYLRALFFTTKDKYKGPDCGFSTSTM